MTRAHPLWRPRIRMLRVLWRVLRPLALGAFLLVAVRLLGLPDTFHEQATVVFLILVVYGVLWALALEALAPFRPELRLVPATDDRARRLAAIVQWFLLLAVGLQLALYLLEANAVHPAFAAVVRLVRNAGLVLVAWMALARSGVTDRWVPDRVENVWDLLLTWTFRFVLPFGVVVAMAWLTLRALGYVGLAHWSLQRAGWTAIAIVAVALLHGWIRLGIGVFLRFLRDEKETPTAEVDAERGDAQGWIALDRTLRLLLSIGAVLLALFVVLRIWGVDGPALRSALSARLPLASDRTWMDLVRGAVQVSVVLLIGRIVREILVFIVFPSRNTEVGARYAIVTVLKYVVLFLAVMVGAGAVGFDMSAITVFAGGAGVGLSFALKDILGNFFSGLILLFERPVRVGDLIEVGGVSGRVEAIRLRGTVIRAFNQSSVIIPNQQMIGERLTNLTQHRTLARMEVAVGVAYDSDLQHVETVLLREARGMPGVVDQPAPFVRVSAFGASSVDMTLFWYTDRVGERGGIQYELQKRIFKTFASEGIEMPNPQLDVHLGSANE